MSEEIKIVTRSSKLALEQSQQVGNILIHSQFCDKYSLVHINTKPDLNLHCSLQELGGKRSFLLELEDRLHVGDVDLAVHSYKDVPADPNELDNDFTIIPMIGIGNCRDCLVANFDINSLADLPTGAVVGTSSLRRTFQMQLLRPDLKFKLCRGNVNTRIAKLRAGDFDILILASAGLHRLGLADLISYEFSLDEMVPSAGQGIIAVQMHKNNDVLADRVLSLAKKNLDNFELLLLERKLIAMIGATCMTPIGIKMTCNDSDEVTIKVFLASKTGEILIKDNFTSHWREVENLISTVSEKIVVYKKLYS